MIECLYAAVIPPYSRFDAYMKANKASGQIEKIREYDRLAEVLHRLRNLDFGVKESWTGGDAPSYKGCEPLKTGRRSVHCH